MEQQVTNRLDLSPFDQTIPRLYVHKLFCFEFPDPDRQPEAVERLEQCLSATILRWPFITGRVGPDQPGTHQNMLQLCYTTPVMGELERHVLVVKTLSEEEFPWTYQQLAEAGMPPSTFNMHVLSTVPEWPKSGEVYPALAMQANFIDGGLLLCFAFHHAVADGSSFTTFLKEFAAAMKNPPKADSGTDMAVQKRLSYTIVRDCYIRSLHSFPECDPRRAPVRPASSGTTTTRILTFSAATVKVLEDTVSQHLKRNNVAQTWVSNIACLSSLVWVAVIRVRQARLGPSETAKIGIAVNIRSVMDPPLPEEYFGNAIVHTIATATVAELLGGDPSTNTIECQSSIPVATVAMAALRMRQAVRGVNSTYVDDRLKTFSALSDPTEVSRAYTRAMDTSNTGIDFSSWRDQGADIEFGIPGTASSTVGYWRKAWSPNEGAYNILPRKGGSKGNADWEVSLGLGVEDMEKVCAEGELGAWVSRVVE